MYIICAKLPSYERYVMINQMTRAAISVPSNLAEGQQRTDKEFNNFIRIARGSLSELKVQLEICKRLYPDIDNDTAMNMIDEIGKMTYGLMLRLKADN